MPGTCLFLLLLFGCVVGAAPWEAHTEGEAWSVAVEPCPSFTRGRVEKGIVVRFPGNTWSEAGQHGLASCSAAVPAGQRVMLRFTMRDSFIGPTAGYHVLQAMIDDTLVWEADVAGGALAEQPVEIDVTDHVAGHRQVRVSLGVGERKPVSNFPLEAAFSAVALVGDGDATTRLTEALDIRHEPLPPDPPLLTATPNTDWAAAARIVQPWGRTQHTAIVGHERWAPEFAGRLGFNAMIVLPPEAHNAIRPGQPITEEQFEAAVAAYRSAGLKLILYSSIMHCGHAPIWQTGQLAKDRAEWSQRDREGNPIVVWGAEWLCPSTGALQYTLDYTEQIVRRWNADAVMLDNNEFMRTAAGLPTCYCDSCRKAFREYVGQRFGEDATRRFFGVPPGEIETPAEPGDLFSLWIHWRNRVWAEAMEQFRQRLRKISPDMVLLANTQYQYSSWLLATDLQYTHEDAMLSESRGLTSRTMAAKMQLGRALAAGRPLWNYIGTFEEQDFTRLRPAPTVAGLLAASLAHGANPWIVFYGFAENPEENAASQQRIAETLQLHRRHEDAFARARPYARVVSLLSTRQRNYFSQPLLPAHLQSLRERRIPAETMRIDEFASRADTLPEGLTVVAEGLTCLTEAEAGALAGWVERGGTLLATADVGWYDEIGRLRNGSALWGALAGTAGAEDVLQVGAGLAVRVESPTEIADRLAAEPPLVAIEPSTDEWEIVPWRQDEPPRLIVHVLWHGEPRQDGAVTLTLRLPAGYAATRALRDAPTLGAPQPLEWQAGPESDTVRLRVMADQAGALVVLDLKPDA